MTISLEAWRAGGTTFVHRGHPIFHCVEGDGDALVLLHGFPTASWDWAKLWPALTARYRCYAADFIGLGWSAKPRPYRYTIADQADLVETMLAIHGVARYRVLAHDYGDTVAQELIARDPTGARVVSVVLLNGGLFPEAHRAVPTQRLLAGPLGPLAARFVGRGALARSFRRIFGRATPPSEVELDGYAALLEHNGGRLVLPALLGYLAERIALRERWVGALVATPVPLRFVVGAADPISGAHMAARYRELVPNPDVVELASIGHYPQVEAPDAVLGAVLAHFEEKGVRGN